LHTIFFVSPTGVYYAYSGLASENDNGPDKGVLNHLLLNYPHTDLLQKKLEQKRTLQEAVLQF
jgi:hypothetical protein